MPALELRPNCELCDRDLPPQSYDARICSNECTWCAECTDRVLMNVCPNCGGELVRRPIRPMEEHRQGQGLRCNPAGCQFSRARDPGRQNFSLAFPP
ncbi:MAG: DUF1272 domain-containing protein [Myxococcales bacterium]